MNISPPPGAEKFIKMRRFEPEQDAPPFECRIKRGGDFLDEYKPIIYAIDGMLPSGSIYGLTGRRGTGKTALLQGTALSVITGRQDILGLEPEQGRVAYVVLENPQDFRMKLVPSRQERNQG
jgi:ABC-type multidrug transport system ATPase subunit